MQTASANRIAAALPDVLEEAALFILVVTVALVIYQDDIQVMALHQTVETPTIYNTRILGLKGLDWLTLLTIAPAAFAVLLRGKMEKSVFHKYVFAMLAVYLVAGIVGFVYGVIYDYPWERWYQDLQQTLYVSTYFFLVFELLRSLRSWWVLFLTVLGVMAVKNLLVLARLFLGIGRAYGIFGVRTIQSADAVIFLILFCVCLLFLMRRREHLALKLALFAIAVIYLFNGLISMARTIWVLVFMISAYLYREIDHRSKRRMMFASLIFGTASLGLVLVFFPRFLDAAVWKVQTIFDWSVGGDRSNATRTLEFLNIGNRLLSQFALFHGMGLGAWWDDRAFPLLPDAGSGFMGKTRFYMAHVWVVEQALKIGLVGIAVYWTAAVKFFLKARKAMQKMYPASRDRVVLLGLNTGLLALYFSSTDLVKVFLIQGVLMGLIARFIVLHPSDELLPDRVAKTTL